MIRLCCPVPHDFGAAYRIAQSLHRIIGIPLDGVHDTSITGFHNPHMVSYTISAPVKVNYRAGSRDAVSILPLASGAEPFHAGWAAGVLGHNARLDITALVGAPAHKAGAPLYQEGLLLC